MTSSDTPEVQALIDEIDDPATEPPRRLAIGDRLAALGDPRPGVGLLPNGLPDIAWVAIPGGPFVDQHNETHQLPAFRIGRYPVTNAQYQAFVDDRGYAERRWWEGLERPQPEASRWSAPNRPRTDLDWHEAVAFTRWLNARLALPDGSIRLPTGLQWARAARGEQGLRYPWGNAYRRGLSNVMETAGGESGRWYLGQTTAVGLYPHGRSADGVEDLAGTVWEWCLDEDADSEIGLPDLLDAVRVLRGGSWGDAPDLARTDARLRDLADIRDSRWGLRLSASVPIESVR